MSILGRILDRLTANVMSPLTLDPKFWTDMVYTLGLDIGPLEALYDAAASLEVGERKVVPAGHKESTFTKMELKVEGKTRKFRVGTDNGFAGVTRIK